MEDELGRELFELTKDTSFDVAGINIFLRALSIEMHRRDPALAQGIIDSIRAISKGTTSSEVKIEGIKRALDLAGHK